MPENTAEGKKGGTIAPLWIRPIGSFTLVSQQ